MLVEINYKGELQLSPQNSTEAYALHWWMTKNLLAPVQDVVSVVPIELPPGTLLPYKTNEAKHG